MIIDFDTQQLTEQIALLKATNGEMFTAHDVTRAVRVQVGRGMNVPHADVKAVVHALWERGGLGADYTRTLADFTGVSPLPWIYHKTTDDPANYRTPADDMPPNPLHPGGGLSIDVGTAGDDVCQVDARATLCIPAKYVRAIGLEMGDTGYVYPDYIEQCVYLSPLLPSQDHAEYSVDRCTNVRITQTVLQRFAQGGNEYKVTLNGGSVKIVRQS